MLVLEWYKVQDSQLRFLGIARKVYGGFPKLGVPFGGPHSKDYSILGSTLGVPLFWETTWATLLLDASERFKGLGFRVLSPKA